MFDNIIDQKANLYYNENMNTINTLIGIGFTEKEAQIYLALLSFRRATAYLVHQKSGLKKATAYVILEELVKKGFVLKIPQNRKSFYIAKSPTECIKIFQEKLNEAKDMLPELLAIQKKDEEKVSVSYFEGIEGIKEVYNDTLKYPGEFVAFGSEDVVSSLGYDWMNDFIKNRVKKNIQVRVIVPTTKYFKENLILKDKQELRTIKFIDQKKYPFSIEIDIYGESKVSLISGKEAMGAIIESTEVHNTMKLIFEILWEKLHDTK
ncbi:MAG: Transcriptional regulator, TrmB [uncultured bacterium]|nr:MAG: Transcriptional regulator, TrmB [uncultured bacterium]